MEIAFVNILNAELEVCQESYHILIVLGCLSRILQLSSQITDERHQRTHIPPEQSNPISPDIHGTIMGKNLRVPRFISIS